MSAPASQPAGRNDARAANALAVLGAAPMFTSPLHVGRPNIGDRAAFHRRIDDMLDRRWLSNGGTYEREFERLIAEKTGARHAVAMCNATLALELVARALGMTGEVIVPSFTFVATVHALAWQGAVPVFCDVDPRTHCLDPERVEALITPRTTGIVGVHVWGRACDVDALADIAARHQLPLVFDAAHAFGCAHRGQPIGRFGRAEVFSFHATKFVNAFEGGAVTTNDDELDRKLRLARNFGFTDYDKVDALGLNAKMHEASAAMGITSIESMDDVIAINRRNMARYERGLSGLRGISLYRGDAGDRSNYQYVVVEVDAADASIDRDALVRVLHAENVMARKYFYPGCHQLEPYRSRWPDAGRSLPHTEALTSRVMCLPTGTAVADADIDAICSVVRAAIARSDEVRAALRA